MSVHAATIRNSAKALIFRDRSVLLQSCRIDGQVVYLLPGGTQEFGESLDATVRREVWEETRLRIEVAALLWVQEFIARNHMAVIGNGDHAVQFIFRCIAEADAEIGDGSLPDAAQLGVRWVPLAELPLLTVWPEEVKRRLIAWDTESTELSHAYLGDCR